METHHTATEHHLPYGVTRPYTPPGEHTQL